MIRAEVGGGGLGRHQCRWMRAKPKEWSRVGPQSRKRWQLVVWHRDCRGRKQVEAGAEINDARDGAGARAGANLCEDKREGRKGEGRHVDF